MTKKEVEMQKTSLNIEMEKYQKFRAIASLKYKKDIMTSALNEGIDLFIEKNKKLLRINDPK